ncbi:hypothetical protein [Helicobacter fennelliae]|uniref:hypothetical protein n=1 Tax=Helicobacter fennelliae TaxID=215 RepID=UPI000E005531|nr:hypothetical protein [Helicobacter fennelliae]STQ83776.1 Uncharacterised protein [Helicobacter fennelliae]
MLWGGGRATIITPNHPISQPNQPNQHVQLKIAQKQVIAIDSIYQNSPQNLLPKTSFSNIIFASDIFQILESKMCDMFFASDVLHHLGLDFYHALFNALTQAQTQWIVIKDIDANYTFGNFANTMHDLLINGERVRKIYPQQIQTLLESKGYKTWKFFLPKLWYPHFLLLAHLQPNNKI